MAMVELIDPAGRRVEIPAENAEAAQRDGFRLPNDEERRAGFVQETYGGVGGQIAAGVAGAAEMLSGGWSNVALKQSGLVDPEVLSGLKEANPNARLAGQAAGVLSPMALGRAGGVVGGAAEALGATTTGISAVGKAVERSVTGALVKPGVGLARSIAARGAGAAAGSAVEGAIYGAGQLVGEEALGETEFTAEAVMAHIGAGAVLGGAIGGSLGVLGGVAGAAGSAAAPTARRVLGRLTSKSTLRKLADESVIKAVGTSSDIAKLSDEKVSQIGSDLLGYKMKDGRNVFRFGAKAEETLDRLRTSTKEVTTDLEGLRKRANAHVRQQPDLLPNTGAMLDRVRLEVLEPLRQSGVPSVQAKANKVFRELAPIQKAWESGLRPDLAALTKFRKGLDSIIWPKKPKGAGLTVAPAHAEQLMQVRGIIEETIEKHTDDALRSLDPALAGRYARTRQLAESLIKARDMSEKAARATLKNRSISLTDHLAGLGALATGNVLLAGGAAVANKLARERGRAAVAVLADKASRLAGLGRAAQTVRQFTDRAINTFSHRPGSSLPRRAAGPAGALLHQISFLPSAAPAMAGEGDGDDARRIALKKRVGELATIAADPVGTVDRMAVGLTEMSEVAPKLTTALSARAVRVAQFLHARAPRPDSPVGPMGLPTDFEPSDDEIDQFERFVEAAVDPLSVVEDLAHRELSDEGVEALRELYPELHAGISRGLLERAEELRETLTYEDVVQLSLWFGVALDDSLQPGFIAAMQQNFVVAAAEEAQQQAAAQGGVRLGGLKTNKASDRLQTSSERLAEV